MTLTLTLKTVLMTSALVLAAPTLAAQTPAPPPTDPAAPPSALPGDPAAPTVGDTAPPPPVAPPAPTAADVDKQLTTLFGDPAPFKAFLTDLQIATAAEDKKAVTAMVAYPFKTKISGETVTFENAADLQKAYDNVFTPAILVAIKAQTYATIFANDMGVMIDSGHVWAGQSGDGEDKAVKIIGINQP